MSAARSCHVRHGPRRENLDVRGAGDGDLGLAVELRHRSRHANEIALADIGPERPGALEDEDAFRRQGVAVLVGGLLLKVEAAEVAPRVGVAVLEVADHDRFDRDLTADGLARGAASLDLADASHRISHCRDVRNGLKKARTSSASASGCSIAAKCPPCVHHTPAADVLIGAFGQ